MPINIINSLQKSIKRFRKERTRNAKKLRKTNIVLASSPYASKVRQVMLTRRQEHKQNIKLGKDLKSSFEKFLAQEKKKEKKIKTMLSRRLGGKTQRRSRTQKNSRRSRTQKNSRRSRTQKKSRRSRRTHR